MFSRDALHKDGRRCGGAWFGGKISFSARKIIRMMMMMMVVAQILTYIDMLPPPTSLLLQYKSTVGGNERMNLKWFPISYPLQAMQGHSSRMKSLPANNLSDPEASPIAAPKTTDESDDGMRQVFVDGVHDIFTISCINPNVHKQASAFASHAHY